MYKQKFPPTQTFARPQISVYNKPYNPPKRTPANYVKELFSIVQEGDLNKVRMYIIDKNMSPSATDDDGNTLIHSVLELNLPNIKEQHKKEFVEYLIKLNVPISTFNKNNITPLHIASKYQYSTIVKLLLDNGATVNNNDNQNMNPLHYVAQGNIVECKDRKKVGAIVPKKVIKMKDDNIFKQLSIVVLDILKDPNFNMYTSHIKNLFRNVKELFPEEIKDKEVIVLNQIMSIYTNKDHNETKKKEMIRNELLSYRNTIEEIANNKLRTSGKSLEIRIDPESGWSPNDAPDINFFDKILPGQTPQKIYNSIDTELSKIQTDAYNGFQSMFSEINNIITLLDNDTSEMYDKLNIIQQLNAFMKENSMVNKTHDYNGTQLPQNIIAVPDGINNVPFNVLSNLYLHIDINPLDAYEINVTGNPLFPREIMCPTKKDIFKMPRLSKIDIKRYKESDPKFKYVSYPLTIDGPFVIIEPIIQLATLQRILAIKIQAIDITPYKNSNSDEYYYISKYVFAIKQIVKHRAILDGLRNAFNDHLNKGYYYEIYNRIIPNMVLVVYNIFQNILLASKEKVYIKETTDKIKNEFERKFPDAKLHPYFYMIEKAVDVVDEMTKMIKDSYDNISKLFNTCSKYITSLNELITMLISLSAIKYIKNFKGLSFASKNITDTEDIFNRYLKKIPNPPNNIDTYYKTYGSEQDINKIKKDIYEKYILTVSNDNYPSYYRNTALPSLNNMTNSSQVYVLHPLPLIHIPLGNIKPKMGYLAVDHYDISKGQQNGLLLNGAQIELKNKNSIDENILEKANDALIGNIGLINKSISGFKSNVEITIISQYIDQHLYIIKFMLIQAIILLCFDENSKDDKIFNTLAPQDIFSDKSKLKALKDIRGQIEKNLLQFDITTQRTAIIYSSVAKMVDELLIAHIKYSIKSGANKYVKNLITGDSKVFDDPEFIATLKSIPSDVLDIDVGFSIDMNSIIKEIVNAFYTTSPPPNDDDYDALNYTQAILLEEKEPEILNNQEYIYNINYRDFNESIEKERKCFKIDPSIVNMLMEKSININQKDKDGNVPLMYALDTQHVKLIEEIMKSSSTSVLSDTVRNNTGLRPFDYAINILDRHNQIVIKKKNNNLSEILGNFVSPLYEIMEKNMIANPDYKNNIIKYMHIILPMVVIMMNNMFYHKAKSYANKISYEDIKNLEEIAKKYVGISDADINNKILPLLRIGNIDDVLHGSKDINPLDATHRKNEKKIENNKKKIEEYDETIKNLNKDIDELTKSGASVEYVDNRKKERDDLITNKNKLESDNVNLSNKNENLMTNMNTRKSNSGNGLTDRITKYSSSEKFMREKDMFKLYNDVFSYVIENNDLDLPSTDTGFQNYMLYNKLWQTLINNDGQLKSMYNIHIVMTKIISSLVDILKNKNITKQELNETKNALDKLQIFYDKLFTPLLSNYRLLPLEYNIQSNHVLKEMMDIHTHIVSKVLCSNLYYALLKITTKYVFMATATKSSNDDEKTKYAESTVKGMMVPQFEKYIITDAPLKLVKLIFRAYEDEYDDDKDFDTIDMMFDTIKNMLYTNTVMPIKRESSLIKSLDEYLFKYYKDLFTQVINSMKIASESYMRYILNEGKYITIMKMMCDKADKEMK